MVCRIQFALKPEIKDTLHNLPKNFPFVFMKPSLPIPHFHSTRNNYVSIIKYTKMTQSLIFADRQIISYPVVAVT